MERGSDGNWRKRKGRTADGYLDQRDAHVAIARLVEEVERVLGEAKVNRTASFADAAAEWLEYAEHTRRL